MAHAQLFNAITDGFPSSTLPKQLEKPSYVSIRDTHRLLTANAASIESSCSRGQNCHLGLILTTTQYALVFRDPFIFPTYPGCTPHFLAWKNPFNKKALLHKHAKKRQQCDECHNFDAALRNKLLAAFEDTYLSPSRTRSPATL